MNKKDMLIISHLRKDGRASLTDLSRKTNIPVSTIFDRIKHHDGFIKRHAVLIDFARLGYNTRANILIKVDRAEREEVKNYLLNNLSVNSVYKVNSNHDFMIDAVFKDIKEMEEFQERMDEKFKIKNKQIYYIIDELKKEEFLAHPEMMKML
ncbi:Lrp/AsnC family transcriptional regulator [Candidatus Woesearchaeota archaeon]|nr:Lrp/AsnC family transcriptional regulator [Candidatus Woesearchaeota archaeon]